MWFFTKKNTVNKTVVTMLPPILGTFQEHTKVLKRYLPKLTKEEMAYAKEKWMAGEYVRFLSPIEVNTKSLDAAQQLEDSAWIARLRAIKEPSCDCDNYYMSSCCGGLNFGIHTNGAIDIGDIKFPDSLLSRGSFMEELTENKPVPLSSKEREYMQEQGVVFSRYARTLEEVA